MTDSLPIHYPGRELWSVRRSAPAPASRAPLEFLDSLAARGDVVPFMLAGRPAVLLNRPDYVSTVLVGDAAAFPKGGANRRARQLLGNGLLTADAAHAERRKAIQPAFARRRLDECADVVVRRARAMCDRWTPGQLVDVPDEIGQLTFAIVGDAIVGGGVDAEFGQVQEAASKATASVDPLVSIVAPLRHVRRAQRTLRAVVERIAARAMAQASEGSLLALLNASDGAGGAEPGQRIDDLLTILLAGHDTMTGALTWTFALLAAHPDAEREMHGELAAVLAGRDAAAGDVARLPFTRAVLAESLRLHPPAGVLARQASARRRFGDTDVAIGTTVLVSQYLLHRDARFFPRPLSFDPQRWLGSPEPGHDRFAYFPFGAGARACIGESFGWMEGVLLLATIGQRWRLQATGAFPEPDVRITMRPRGPVLMEARPLV